MGVPIYHGRIDRTLFESSLRSVTGSKSAYRSPQSRR
jgi:hypothetical protein